MDMVKKHPDYNWQIGKEKEYFLKALAELDKRLADKEIRWPDISQSMFRIFQRRQNWKM